MHLFQDPNADEFEDKDWTFIIENVSGTQPPLLFSSLLNGQKYFPPLATVFSILHRHLHTFNSALTPTTIRSGQSPLRISGKDTNSHKHWILNPILSWN